MDAASELRQAHRTGTLITGGLVTGPVMYAVAASVFRMSHAPSEGAASLPAPEMSLVRHTAWIASNAPGYEAWAPWLALPAPRPCP